MAIRAFLRFPWQVLVPPTCAGCGLPGDACCDECRASLRPIGEPLCLRCGYPLSVAAERCANCRGRLVGSRAAVMYDGAAPSLVRSFKDRGRPALAELLAELIADYTPPPLVNAVLIPIPLTPAGLRARGFNQSELIATCLGRRWGRYVAREGLVRRVDAERQRGASATQRGDQVRGAFALTTTFSAPRSVCLVDDVHTTGATLAAAAQALWCGGSRTITSRCFARAVLHG